VLLKVLDRTEFGRPRALSPGYLASLQVPTPSAKRTPRFWVEAAMYLKQLDAQTTLTAASSHASEICSSHYESEWR